MIPQEILQKVRLIEIKTRHVVNDIFGGEYHSAFKGKGMEFAEVREYIPGDDIRDIDYQMELNKEKVELQEQYIADVKKNKDKQASICPCFLLEKYRKVREKRRITSPRF